MKKHILLIDDDRPYVERMRGILEGKYLVSVAYNGEEALEKINFIKPDLILLDIGMPKMDGLEFFDRITPVHAPPIYPVLVVTVRSNLKELFASLPVVGFVTKPVEMEPLLRLIEEFFEKQKKSVHVEDRRRRSLKVIIVDDNPLNYEKIALWLLHQEITVSVAKTGSTAIEQIIGTDFPNLVLIRLGMPAQPELMISYHLKEMPEARQVHVAVYIDDFHKIDSLKETEIANIVGTKNLLELNSRAHFYDRCEELLELPHTSY